MVNIRFAGKSDADKIRELHLRAFPEEENAEVAQLAMDLLLEQTVPETLSLIAESDGQVAGHMAFSPVTMEGNEIWVGYTLAPLGVSPKFQGRGVGAALVEDGLRRLKELSVDVVLVYGDPKYYGRFGFHADAAAVFEPPHDLTYPFGWQALLLAGNGKATTGGKIRCVAALQKPELW